MVGTWFALQDRSPWAVYPISLSRRTGTKTNGPVKGPFFIMDRIVRELLVTPCSTQVGKVTRHVVRRRVITVQRTAIACRRVFTEDVVNAERERNITVPAVWRVGNLKIVEHRGVQRIE